ncbi:N-acetylmuramoyl-L-alanine amidase [Streptomyces boninensis]|uniref:N-acetylmuramoyl-L-alanine amidase n=1 Tax=Streptomyces boninensis TaxID=2039455 RepID=UPI003B21A42C
MTSSQKTKLALALTAAGAFSFALLAPAGAASAEGGATECPAYLDCDWVPAAYAETPDGNYGNYDTSERPKTNKIKYIVLHDTEETYDDTIKIFQDPARQASAHYLVRSKDGHVAQMVKNKDVAWQAGNWYINGQSIGIEQEGKAAEGAKWYTPELYRSTAALVRHLAAKYDIPLDREHIIGHDNVPSLTTAKIAGMHWDSGPYWDWNYFFTLLGKPTVPTGGPGSDLVKINPKFKENIQAIRDCEQNVDLPAQPSSLLPIYTAPSTDAARHSDPGEHPDGGAGTNCAQDTGAWVSSGMSFVVAERKPGWTAVWYQGEKVWIKTPAGQRVLTPQSGYVVKPKAGKESVPVYGGVYPEKGEYPADMADEEKATSEALPYTLKPGQAYAGGGTAPNGYYYAPTFDSSKPYDHTFFPGATKYVTVQIGSRIGFVKRDDVDIVRER